MPSATTINGKYCFIAARNLLLGICFLREALEGAVEGIEEGEKISWEERGQLTLTPPPHSAQGHKGGWLLVQTSQSPNKGP